jgi:hypothetical protein
VSCVKRGQGFDWNQGKFLPPRTIHPQPEVSLTLVKELFLPSYVDYDSQDLECRQDPVQDIVLTEEEIAAMFPQ